MSKLRADLHYGAVSMDGEFIEDLIPGYQTIMVSGRESISAEIDSYTIGASNGSTIKSTRYPSRELQISFSITGDNPSDLQNKLNQLNNLLSADEYDFVFNDEGDKFFTGKPYINSEFRRNTELVTGVWNIFCAYPFKRSINYITQFPTRVENSSAIFEFEYKGTYPAHPVFRAEFAGALEGGEYSDDGDCGFVAFTDTDGNIIQLGNPEIIDLDGTAQAGLLISHIFTDIANWETTGGKAWESKTISGSVSPNEIISDTYWNNGAGQSLKYVKPSTFGIAANWHGPIIFEETVGASNFEINCVHRLCVSDTSQGGSFELGAYRNDEGSLKLLAGIVIEKTGNGTSGIVKYIINDKVVGTDAIDLSYYNTNFGYCRRDPVYVQQAYTVTVKKKKKKVKETRYRTVQNGWSCTQSNLNTRITKKGGEITFYVGNLASKTFNVKAVEFLVAHNVSFHFGQSGTMTPFNTNAVHTVDFRGLPGPKFADCQNVFTANDIVEADCNDASVTLFKAGTVEGNDVPMYGALGNDWEDFVLKKGTNVIAAIWSPWVNQNYKPTLKIIYNEVFI